MLVHLKCLGLKIIQSRWNKSDSPGTSNYAWQVIENDSQIIEYIDKSHSITTSINKLVYTPGFYLYSYNEELPTGIIDTYTMKVEIKYATLRFGEATEHNTIIYLYYIGD